MKIKYLCPKNKQTNGTKSLIKYWSLNLHIPRSCTCDAILFWDKSEAAFVFSTGYKDASQRAFLQKWNFANLLFESLWNESCGHCKKNWMLLGWIYGVLSKRDNFETKLRSGRPKKSIKRQDIEILRLVSIQSQSIRSISREVTVPVWKSTVHRELQVSKLLSYRKMRRTPNLAKQHKDTRV